jgi:hypothetical protein
LGCAPASRDALLRTRRRLGREPEQGPCLPSHAGARPYRRTMGES